jgi:Baseplate J-like protein
VIYFCSQQNRRALVLQHPALNGIDYLEVCDSGSDCGCGKQLLITLLKDARSVTLTTSQITITGGGADAQVHPVKIAAATADSPRTITVGLDSAGDFSTYTFSLIANPSTADPPDGFDPQLSRVDFSFKAGCETAGDCAPDACCPPKLVAEPDINYLAKEFDGFTQVMLDRLAVLVPGWTETHPSDMGVALVEALAYAADHLSYQQDAVGTEAHLGTARSRISLRRHAKLVDYRLDEGSNARTWIHVEVSKDGVVVPTKTALYPRVPGLAVTIEPGSKQVEQLASALAFETMQSATLYQEQNEIDFYTWSDANCCLAPGSTQATVLNHFQSVQKGTVLIFEEKLGPNTGDPDDADASKRWPVRLTRVQQTDYLNRPLVDPLDGTPITRIWWDPGDALPLPLCISSTTDAAHGSKALKNVSVALGNIIPADHGVWQDWEELGRAPAAPPAPVTTGSCTCGSHDPLDTPRPRYFPQLANTPLTFAVPFDASAPASTFLAPSAVPTPLLCVHDERQRQWDVLDDLLSSHESDLALVPEIERDGTVFLRFGDGEYGMSPDAAASFQAYYRVGNGSMGNIGHDTLAHIVTNVPGIREVRNPLAAAGGRDPETMEHIRQRAPFAFRTQLRAVTEDDYGVMAQIDPAIREARGTLRWTGSWYTAFVSVDAASGDVPSAALVASTKNRLNLLRMTGVDLEVEGAVIVGLRIEMDICVGADHFRGDVRDAIMRVFTTGNQCSGQLGILNPENFTFGETIYTSPLIAAAQAVDGVSSATLTVFQRMDDPLFDGSAQGFLTMHRLEIARCDNDPNRLDHGIFVLHMDGGK